MAPGWRREPPDLVTLPLVFVVGLLVTVLRSPTVIVHPTFWAEDGSIFYQDAYTLGRVTTVFRPNNGYLQVFPRLVADVGTWFPLRDVPLLFALVALVVQVLPAVVVASRRFERLIPDLRVRLLLAALYLAVPNSSEINVNLTNGQWHLALLAVLVVLAAPATGLWRLVDVIVIVLSGLTGPYVLALVVVAAILFYCLRQRWTLVLGLLAGVCAIAEVATLVSSSRADNGQLGATIGNFIDIVGGRIVGNVLLGSGTTQSTGFNAHVLLYSSLLFVLIAVVLGLVLWRGPLELKLFNLWSGLVLAGSLTSPVGFPGASQWARMSVDAGARYWLLPGLAVLADLVWLAGQLRSVRRWVSTLAVVALLSLVVLGAFGVREDFRYPGYPVPSWPAQVSAFEHLPPGSPWTFQIRPPGFTMVLARR